MNSRRLKKITVLIECTVILTHLLAAIHAYKFTHFSAGNNTKTGKPKTLSSAEKLSTLFLGINNPRPINKIEHQMPYSKITIQSTENLSGWHIPVDSAKGTILLFHGYGGNKGSMLDKAYAFNQLGYNTTLIDFSGSGDSGGSQTTIGYNEATQVKDCMQQVASKNSPLILFGTSMGSVAIMRSIAHYGIKPEAIIIECPFATMQETVESRFSAMKLPSFPMASLLLFWGGTINGFYAPNHNPKEYAKQINQPALLLWGDADARVSQRETSTIFNNISGPKKLTIFKGAGHENYLIRYKKQWTKSIEEFLNQTM